MTLKELSLALCESKKIKVIFIQTGDIVEYEDDDALWNALRHNKQLADYEVKSIGIHKGVLDINIREPRQ